MLFSDSSSQLNKRFTQMKNFLFGKVRSPRALNPRENPIPK